MHLTMMEVKDAPEEMAAVRKMPFFDLFEVLLQLLLVSLAVCTFAFVRAALFPSSLLAVSAWSSVLTGMLLLVSLQSLVHIAYLTGTRAFETRAALFVFIWSLVVFLIFDPMSPSTLNQTAAHVNALLQQVSRKLSPLPHDAMCGVVHVCFAFLLALSAAALTLPALRYTQTLQQLTLGREFERAQDAWKKILLWLEFVSPLFVVLAFNPVLCAQQLASDDNNSLRLSETALVTFGMQLGALAWMVLLRTVCFRAHLQAFMDVSVSAIAQALVATDAEQLLNLRRMVETRSRYLLIQATQLISLVGFFCAPLLCLLRATSALWIPALSSLVAPASQHTLLLQSAQSDYLQLNSTSVLLETLADPRTAGLDTSFFAVLGAMGPEAKTALAAQDVDIALNSGRDARLLQQLLSRLGQLHTPPFATSLGLLQTSVFCVSSLWLVLSVLGLGLWLLAPAWLTRAVRDQDQQPQKQQAGQAAKSKSE